MPRSLANGDYSLVMAVESSSSSESWPIAKQECFPAIALPGHTNRMRRLPHPGK
jgi:hypothetical protein